MNQSAPPLESLTFDASWRAVASVVPCSISAVTRFIKAHYLRKRPAICLLTLAMVVSKKPVGCVVFSAPPPETAVRYGGETWELARLFIDDSVPRNAETWLIAQAVRYIKRHHLSVQHLVSYADPSVGHIGTIYVASNWEPDGRTDEERKTPRSDYIDMNTGKHYGRKGNVPATANLTRQPRVSKYRFVYHLTRRSAPHHPRLGASLPTQIEMPL